MTVLSHEREPQELGNASRYAKTVDHLIELAKATRTTSTTSSAGTWPGRSSKRTCSSAS